MTRQRINQLVGLIVFGSAYGAICGFSKTQCVVIFAVHRIAMDSFVRSIEAQINSPWREAAIDIMTTEILKQVLNAAGILHPYYRVFLIFYQFIGAGVYLRDYIPAGIYLRDYIPFIKSQRQIELFEELETNKKAIKEFLTKNHIVLDNSTPLRVLEKKIYDNESVWEFFGFFNEKSVTKELLNKKYKQFMLLTHPDKNIDHKEEASCLCSYINAAYKHLSAC